jgi:L,D-transpeptidase YbiS
MLFFKFKIHQTIYKTFIPIVGIIVPIGLVVLNSLASSRIDSLNNNITTRQDLHNSNDTKQQLLILNKQIQELRKEYDLLKPKSPYLVVNTSDNRFALKQGGQLLHQGKCSTGSYILLTANENRQWLFKTPRGMFKVTVKLKNPVWYKPDWAYLEEGLSIPSRQSPQRYQEGVLGEFALAFGKGYLIHGTLYKRMLGLPVTHGCVRLDDDDMRQVFGKLTHGSRIFIY